MHMYDIRDLYHVKPRTVRRQDSCVGIKYDTGIIYNILWDRGYQCIIFNIIKLNYLNHG